MHEVLRQNTFLVKEHVGLFKAANNFDVFEPTTGQMLMECREEDLGKLTKIFRFTKYKRMTPFDIRIRTRDGRQVVRVRRGTSLFLSKVEVLDENDQTIGEFRQKFLSLGGAFDVHDASGRAVCSLKGKWTGWDFKFVSDGREYGHVSKKWNGVGKELFTSADNYVLSISDSVPPENAARPLILAAVMCIDLVLKE